jgi:hypothetical protein
MIPGKILGGTFVKEEADSIEFSADNLDDRIINLKFIRKSKRCFTIRSDYEAVHHDDGGEGSTSFKRCVEKPDIKVTYRQVAEKTAIEVNIEINNYSTGDIEKEKAGSMDSVNGDPVIWCIVQMGYRAQFPDWTSPEYSGDIEGFYDLKDEKRSSRQIQVQILTGYAESYPPDKKVVFKGIIGTMENGLRWDHTEEDLVKGYGDPAFPDGLSEIEEVLFQFITRRFIRPSILNIAGEIRESTGREWTGMPALDNGLMAVEDANKYGVICTVSKTLRNLTANALHGYDLTPEEAAAVRPIPPASFNDMQDTIGSQLVRIQQHYPFLHWYALTDGNFYFYHEDDTDEDLWSDPFVKAMQKKPIFLPAIYDMTPAGTRTIRCPFVSFISPMSTAVFQSRFSIGTLTSFFYPVQTNAFLVIIAAIEFATVQDTNVMELMCVDLPPKEIEIDEKTGEVRIKENEEPDETPKEAQLQPQRNMQWIEKELTVVVSAPGPFGADNTWESIVKNKMVVMPDRWPEGGLPDEKAKLLALMDWNRGSVNEWMQRDNSGSGVSVENHPSGIGGRTGVKVPWLLAGDKIIVRRPFQPEYPEDEKVTV